MTTNNSPKTGKKTLKARDIERLENTSFASALIGGGIDDTVNVGVVDGTNVGCSVSCEESACCSVSCEDSACCVKSVSCEESACCVKSVSCETACTCGCVSVACCITFTCPSVGEIIKDNITAIDIKKPDN